MRNRLGLFLLFVIVTAAVIGGVAGSQVNAEAPLEDEPQRLLKSFTEAIATIQSNYIREVPSEDLVENAIRGMLRTLDPHSSFFSRRDYNRLQEEQQGKYYGLGITIRPEAPGSGRVVIVEPPAPGTPAYKAGLRAGDVIATIEGEPIDDWDLNEEVIPNLKGPKGTRVNITVERPGEPEPLEFSVERDEIPLYTIKYAFWIEPGVAYIRIDRFSETTGRELDQALTNLGENQMKGLLLDLRDNPGGALSQALEVSDRFLEKGQTIVSTRNRNGKDREYSARRGERYEYPIVVLINENSASASEIVAGALQDHDRALIVGKTSFGKALVQTIFPLEDNRGLALTTGRYYTPSDRLIQRDYSDSFWDYYNNRDSAQVEKEEREEYLTDGGRTVYGGGGITPDRIVEVERLGKPVRRIQRASGFREFASKLYGGGIESDVKFHYTREELEKLSPEERSRLASQLEVTDLTLQRFDEFLEQQGVDLTEQEFEENREVISNILKQELLMLLFGDEESYRIGLQLDNQVQVALDMLPVAASLLEDPDRVTPEALARTSGESGASPPKRE